MTNGRRIALNLSIAIATGITLHAQGTLADYQRAHDLQAKVRDLVINVPGPAHWIAESHHFWYAHSVKGGAEYILVDAEGGTKKIAFDHEKLAASISTATGKHYTAQTLPFSSGLPHGRPGPRLVADTGRTAPLIFLENEKVIQFGVDGSHYKCDLQAYACTKTGLISDSEDERREANEDPVAVSPEAADPEGPGGDPKDGLAWQPPASQNDDVGRYSHLPQACASAPDHPSRSRQHGARRSGRMDLGSQFPGQLPAESPDVCTSFDGKWEVFIRDFNVYLKPTGKGDAFPLSFDGTENNYYSLRSVAWSPDSKKLAAYHTRPGFDREVMYIESSPRDQLQPKHMTTHYVKPGDPVDIAYPVLFDVAAHKGIEIDSALFPNPYDLSTPVWWKDNRGFTFEYNQRGHQAYKVIEVDANTGRARALIDEEVPTFFYYNDLGPGLSAGRKFRYDVNDGKEIIWASERDGWSIFTSTTARQAS